jgi:hypothetical protein
MAKYLPREFLSYDQDEQVKIVNLGLVSWSALQAELEHHTNMDSDKLIQLWKEQGRKEGVSEKEKEVKRLLKEKQDLIDDLNSELRTFSRRLETVEKEHQVQMKKVEVELAGKLQKEVVAQKDILVREARLDFMDELNTLKAENAQLRLAGEFKSAYEFAQKRFEEVVAQKDELQRRVDDLTCVRSSFLLGKEGEGEIEGYLKKCVDFDFTNVHTEPDKADFRITTKDGKSIILDSKKFTNAVPKKDRDKLLDNTDKDAGVCAGIMVSLNSKISARQHCEIEFSPANKPVLYLCLQSMTTEAKLHCIDMGVKFLLKLVSSRSEKERGELLEKMKVASISITDCRNRLENIKRAATDVLENTKMGLNDCKVAFDVLVV